jgi:hypothetical protein
VGSKVTTTARATIDDLYRVPERGKAEIVDGELVLMSPTGGRPGLAGGAVYASLRHRNREAQPRIFRRGEVADAEPAVRGWTFPVEELFE